MPYPGLPDLIVRKYCLVISDAQVNCTGNYEMIVFKKRVHVTVPRLFAQMFSNHSHLQLFCYCLSPTPPPSPSKYYFLLSLIPLKFKLVCLLPYQYHVQRLEQLNQNAIALALFMKLWLVLSNLIDICFGFQTWAVCEVNSEQHMWSKFFFFCVPGHVRSSVQWVRQSPLSAAVPQPVPKAFCGHPSDWAMSGVSKRRRWGRFSGCGWGFEDLCCIDICLNGKFSVCGGGRGVGSV